jgi:DNA-binding NtrC family response regulator
MEIRSTSGFVSAGALLRPSLKALVREYERGLIAAALEESGGNQRRAARALRVLPTTLNEKMKRLGLRAASPLALTEITSGSAAEGS